MMSELPKVKIDLKGIREYARNKEAVIANIHIEKQNSTSLTSFYLQHGVIRLTEKEKHYGIF